MPSLDQEIKAHRRLQSWRAIATLAADHAAIVVFALAAERAGTAWAKAVAWVLIAGRQVALANLLHSAIHGSFLSNARLAARLDFVLAYPILDSMRRYRTEHLEHHQEFARRSPERYAFLHEELGLARRGFWGRTWVVFVRPLLGYDALVSLRGTARLLAKDRRMLAGTLALWALVFAVAAYLGCVRGVLFYWFGPLLLLTPTLHVWAEISDHFGAPDETRNQAGLFYGLLIKGHELYHAVHHRYPFIPFYRMREAHALLVARGEATPACRGFTSFLRVVYSGLGAR